MMGERAAAVAAFLLMTSLPVGCHELRPNPVDAGVDPAALAAAAAPAVGEVQRAQAQGAPLRAGRPAVGHPGTQRAVERPEAAPRAPEESR